MSKENGSKQALQSLTATINKKISECAQKIDESLSSTCIYRVPEKLRKLKESAYTPGLVSIGPLHSKDKHLQSRMQGIKMSYVESLLRRMTDGSEKCKFAVLEECVEAMKLLVEDAKKCYNEEVDNLNEEMLVVDGCFILELLYRYKLHDIPNDPVFGSGLMSSIVSEDLLLLENQLPFFVLEKLFDITMDKIPDCPPNYLLFDYVVSYFSNMPMSIENNSTICNEDNSTTSNVTNCCLLSEYVLSLSGNTMNSENKGIAEPNKSKKVYYHILHVLHDHCLPPDLPIGEDYIEAMPSASYLDYAGVKFVAGTRHDLLKVKFTETQSCLERCFSRARFEIPTLNLYDSTEHFLRNLIAFEQCCLGVSGYFTSYVFFIDMLVNSAKDIEVLQKAGIIKIYLGADQKASDLFNNLCKEVVLQEFFFVETCKQAIKYSKRWWPATVAHVRHKYNVIPWTSLAFGVAFISFGMEITQFVRSFFK
ncbi:UPF0481 protein [Actinidia chinensis var. chinensis]|uniref:UPF0481 protein n=1 Tax=Actinidia chinensis var. chinensis TaxID=1590841 RepID=A0A2R6P657_ACTCC|nr:UPF0481 protein [Actinidia chinensis var. chinensis]